MALAIASGVAPQYGLYTAIVGGIVIALTGGSRINISGPTAAFVVILLPIVHNYGLGGLLISGLLAGIILLAMGLARLGSLIEMVPYPVTVGFTAGIAVVIGTFQVPNLLGLHLVHPGVHYLDRLMAIIRALPGTQWDELFISAVTLATLILWPKLKTRVPGHLAALVLGTGTAWIGHQLFAGFDVATIGSSFHYHVDGLSGDGIPPVPLTFVWPWALPDAHGHAIGISPALIYSLMGSAFAIAMLGAIESLLCTVVADGMTGRATDPNRELIGQGIGNILVPFFGGIPATAAIARTVTNIGAGGSAPLSSVVHSLFVLAAIVLIAPLLAYIPMASMGAILLIVAWNMSEAKHFMHILKAAPRNDVLVLLTCFGLTVLINMEIAVAAGMALAAMLFIKRMVELTEVQLIGSTEAREYPAHPSHIAIYDINGAMFFGAAQRALKNILNLRQDIRVVILDMSDVPMMDMTGIVALSSITENLARKRTLLIINGLRPHIVDKLKRAGIAQVPGRIAFAPSIDASLQLAAQDVPEP
jgi:sulfate permease, SulP family